MLDIYTVISLFDTIISVGIPFAILSKWKIISKRFLLYVISVQAIGMLIIYLNINNYVILILMLIIAIILLYRSEKNLLKSITIPIFALIITIISENIVIIFYNSFIDNRRIERSGPKFVFLLFIILILNILISKLLASFIHKRLDFNIIEFKSKTAILLIISLLLTLIIFYANIIIRGQNGNPITNLNIDLINAVMFIIYFILLMIIIRIILNDVKKEFDIKKKEEDLKNLKEYTENLEALYTEMRGFRHDYMNILSAMYGYIQEKKYKELEKFFYERIIPLNEDIEKKNIKIGTLKNIRIPELKGVVSSKIIVAQEKGININIEIVNPIENINFDIIDLCRCVGILLDNAIEESLNCESPELQFAIIDDKFSIKIIIVNSYNESDLNLQKIFVKGFSTKGENRGMGLYNLRLILNHYQNVTLDTLFNHGEFRQVLNIRR